MGLHSILFPGRAMRGVVASLASVLAVLAVMSPELARGSVEDPVLKPGDLAPDFMLPGSDGRTHTLAEHRGVRPVVIAWFPRAFAKE